MMYLEGGGPYQTVMIVCGCNSSSHIITLQNMNHLYSLAKFSHITHVIFATLDIFVGTMLSGVWHWPKYSQEPKLGLNPIVGPYRF